MEHLLPCTLNDRKEAINSEPKTTSHLPHLLAEESKAEATAYCALKVINLDHILYVDQSLMNMRVEKQVAGGEGGRYAGGLLHLFDWNMKSRKKFTETPDLSEQLKQKRIGDKNNPITQFHSSNGDMAGRLIRKDCGFSLIDEDDYGKSPGVVARLMGLDSFPTSSFSDTHSNRFVDSRYVRKSLEETEQKDTHQIDRKLKVIEKFQTEFLPKNSARSVPTTPIKNSGFVSYDDPLPSSRKPSCRRPMESNAARNLKGQSMTKSWDGCLDRKPFPEEGKKSVSLAIQAKINVKKREGSLDVDNKLSLKLNTEIKSRYVTIDKNHGKKLYYYYVLSERNPSQDPVVLWLNGGPGCSGFDGFVYEHGPFNFEKTGSLPKLHLNPYAWTKVSNMIYLDSPAGVGMSYSGNKSDYTTGDIVTASDSHEFLLEGQNGKKKRNY